MRLDNTPLDLTYLDTELTIRYYCDTPKTCDKRLSTYALLIKMLNLNLKFDGLGAGSPVNRTIVSKNKNIHDSEAENFFSLTIQKRNFDIKLY